MGSSQPYFKRIRMYSSFFTLVISIFLGLVFLGRVHQARAAFDDDLNCLVCEVIVNEVEKAVAAVDPKKIIDLGGRLQADGSPKTNKKQLRRSEIHLSEVLETLCEDKMADYAQGHWKETGVKDLLPIIVNGQMNPRMSEFEFMKDSNLNKGIKDYCETIVEEKEEELLKYLSEDHENASHQFCYHVVSDICPQHDHESRVEL